MSRVTITPGRPDHTRPDHTRPRRRTSAGGPGMIAAAVAAGGLAAVGVLTADHAYRPLFEARITPPSPVAISRPPTSVRPSDGELALIRATLLALNTANATARYETIHALGSPAFQVANSVASLDERFRPFRQRGVDLGAVAVAEPEILDRQIDPPATPGRRLHLAGEVPARAMRIRFNLVFTQADGRWRIDTLGVATAPNVNVSTAQ